MQWREIGLGEVLIQVRNQICIDDECHYKQVTVCLHGRGLRLRAISPGKSIKTKKQFIVRPGQLIYSRIDARNGAIGLVPTSLDGAIVTGDFPVFDFDQSKVNPRYLGFLLTTQAFAEECRALSRGVTNRQRVKEGAFLSLKIRIPESIEEQDRLVQHIDGVLSRLHLAEKTSEGLRAEVDGFMLSCYQRIVEGAQWLDIDEIAVLQRRGVDIQSGELYPELGVRSFGRGTFHKPALTGEQLGGKRIYRIEPGDLVFNNVFAWEGAVAVARPEDKGRVGSHRFITFVPLPDKASAYFLQFHFLTQKGLEDLGKASPGSAGRNRTLGLKALCKIKVPVPPLEKQQWFDRLVMRRQRITKLQDQKRELYAAFMPALLAKAFQGEL